MWTEKLEEEALVVFPKSNEINSQVNPKSCGFTKIISYLHSLVDTCDPDVTLEMNLKQPELLWYGISEEYLRLRIEKYFLPKLEKYCKKSKTSYNILLRPKILLFHLLVQKLLLFLIIVFDVKNLVFLKVLVTVFINIKRSLYLKLVKIY